MASKMFDKSNCVTCAQSSLDKSTLKKQRNLTSQDIVQKLDDSTKTGGRRGMLVYEVFKEGRWNKKRGRLYLLKDCGEQLLVDLFDISLSHRIVGIGWTDSSWAIRVYFEESKDGQTNIDGEVMEAFKRMVEAQDNI